MMNGKTRSGFEFTIDERSLDDYALLEAIGKFDAAGNKIQQASALTEIIDYLLGENKEAFMEHIKKNNDGFRPIEAVRDEILDMMTITQELKNS